MLLAARADNIVRTVFVHAVFGVGAMSAIKLVALVAYPCGIRVTIRSVVGFLNLLPIHHISFFLPALAGEHNYIRARHAKTASRVSALM